MFKTNKLCFFLLFLTVTVPLVPVDAVEGRSVKFPCDVSSPNPADKVYMVFWFKDDSGVPLYRYNLIIFLLYKQFLLIKFNIDSFRRFYLL